MGKVLMSKDFIDHLAKIMEIPNRLHKISIEASDGGVVHVNFECIASKIDSDDDGSHE